jgi:hypothetical protein
VSLEWILLGLRVVAAVILYSFLGIAFYLIWRELKYAVPLNLNINCAYWRPWGEACRVKCYLCSRLPWATTLGIPLFCTMPQFRPGRLLDRPGACGGWRAWTWQRYAQRVDLIKTNLSQDDVIGIGGLRFKLK